MQLEAGTDASGRPGIYVRCPTPNSADVSHHPFQAEIDELVDCILAGRETMLNVFDAQKTMEICIAADQSAAQGGVPVALAADRRLSTPNFQLPTPKHFQSLKLQANAQRLSETSTLESRLRAWKLELGS